MKSTFLRSRACRFSGPTSRRRWWLGAIPAVAIALSWFGWSYTERPPFAFMQGSQTLFVEVDTTGVPTCLVTYVVQLPIEGLEDQADLELTAKGYEREPSAIGLYGGVSSWVSQWAKAGASEVRVSLSDYDPKRPTLFSFLYPSGPVPRVPSLPAHATGFVTVTRDATLIDRARAWLYGLRYDAATAP